jgi:hypothetical protein
MYRSFSAMWEGWTKNLALLFRHPLGLAALRSAEFIGIFGLITASTVLGLNGLVPAAAITGCAAVLLGAAFLFRIRRAHFSWDANLLSLFGLPFFASLLIRSWLHSRVRGAVTWKGRKYSNIAPEGVQNSSTQE